MIWGSKLCSAIYPLSPHLWGKTYKSFEHPVFAGRFQRQECHASCVKTTDVRMGNGTSGAKNQRGGMTRILCFLPDHFLYRGVVRTVVHVLVRVGAEKQKTNHLTGSVNTLKQWLWTCVGDITDRETVDSWESAAVISMFFSLHVSFLHLRRCVPVDMTPSSYVCCGTPHAPTPCAVRSVHEIRCATDEG